MANLFESNWSATKEALTEGLTGQRKQTMDVVLENAKRQLSEAATAGATGAGSVATLNKVMLIGHLGDDVKIRHFDGGGCIARFPLATNETYTNKSTNEKVTNTDWHNIVVRNKAAEICEKYLAKGDKVYVEGRIKTRKWQGEDGQDRYTTEVNVDEFTFLSAKKESNSDNLSSNKETEVNIEEKPNPTEQPEDDLPF